MPRSRNYPASIQVASKLRDFIKYLQVIHSAAGTKLTVSDIVKQSLKEKYPEEFKTFSKMVKGDK